ncbi:hypothetical protein LSH36_470g00028 [Paralvinella palmiformis]|uniref:Uncharacterized protein n=1 Tax=Paralvinella palmiformis TaxID=53620 RepID=A0AAD9J9D9_9ANNE|nr:hypothetical protein LSH36_470g00028 [Paralvinella palmiformis]
MITDSVIFVALGSSLYLPIFVYYIPNQKQAWVLFTDHDCQSDTSSMAERISVERVPDLDGGHTNDTSVVVISDDARPADINHDNTKIKSPTDLVVFLDPDAGRSRLSATSDASDVFGPGEDADVPVKATRESTLRLRMSSREDPVNVQENGARVTADASSHLSGSGTATPSGYRDRTVDNAPVDVHAAGVVDQQIFTGPRDGAQKVYKQKGVNELKRNRSQMERILKIPHDSSFRQLARQISGRDKYRVGDEVDHGNFGRKPKNFFDLALVTMCCCVSPLGIVAIIMAVLSDANYKAGHLRKSVTYSRLALTFSVLGMLSSVTLAVTLLMLFRYPWNQFNHP